MSERYRLNLEAPFLAASTPERKTPSNDGSARFERTASRHLTEAPLRRPSPHERAMGGDYTGEAMARYISGLETRMAAHFRRHAPRWHEKETRKILARWSAPQPKPAPKWAPAFNRRAEAQDYAAALLRERLRARMQRVGEIRIARTLGGYGEVDPLHLIFHDRSVKFRMKQ